MTFSKNGHRIIDLIIKDTAGTKYLYATDAAPMVDYQINSRQIGVSLAERDELVEYIRECISDEEAIWGS